MGCMLRVDIIKRMSEWEAHYIRIYKGGLYLEHLNAMIDRNEGWKKSFNNDYEV